MGFYREHVLPRVQDKVMSRGSTPAIRARVCESLKGAVVEVGFGTGLNAPHYPAAVRTVVAIEPSRVCMRIAERRITATSVEVEYGGLTGEMLDLPSDEFDAVLSTWTLCTIPNLGAALAEMRRVLRPSGSLHFVEHGHSPDPNVERWQRRLEPMNKRLGGGCHLTRRIPEELERAGFTIDKIDTYYVNGELKPMGYTFEGRATRR
jgi:ubiquinone/menaquinone biosynthesis C-methylase UbiE